MNNDAYNIQMTQNRKMGSSSVILTPYMTTLKSLMHGLTDAFYSGFI
jgi:hypothetical protein